MKLNIRTWAALVLGFLSGIFVFQNMQVVDVRFLFWKFSVSSVILLLLTLIMGIVIGFLLGWEVFSRRRKKKQEGQGRTQPQMPPTSGS